MPESNLDLYEYEEREDLSDAEPLKQLRNELKAVQEELDALRRQHTRALHQLIWLFILTTFWAYLFFSHALP